MLSVHHQVCRVLLVEDDRAVRRVLRATLTRRGHSAYEAETVAEALELLSWCTFEAVVTDYNLPDGNGGQVLEAARTRGIARRVLHSASAVVCDSELARTFRKPADLREIVAVVEGAWSRRA
jgi:DNA-binding NtrC family response regulator